MKDAIIIAFGLDVFMFCCYYLLRSPTFLFLVIFLGYRQERLLCIILRFRFGGGSYGRFPAFFVFRCLLPFWINHTTLVSRTGATTAADDANTAT